MRALLLAVMYAGRRSGGGAASSGGQAGGMTVLAPILNYSAGGVGTMTISWMAPDRNRDGTAPTILSYNLYYTTSSDPTQAKSGGTGSTPITGISAAATSQVINSLSSGTYIVAMETVNANGAGDLSVPIYVTVT